MTEETKPAESSGPSIPALKTEIQMLQQEIRILEGKLKNRRPEFVQALKADNERLTARAQELERIWLGVQLDLLQPKDKDEMNLKVETQKISAAASFRASSIDESLWKNLVS